VDGVAHETVKPVALMKFLVRLCCPPGGSILDPFLGSGTTAEACLIEGFQCIGIERDERYLPLIKARLSKPLQPVLDFDGGEAS
jgi:site-specific DNA-methyltransferase (adenine-specific)